MVPQKKSFFREFLEFLQEYKIVALAIAFVVGSASTALVNSLVKDIVLPLVTPLLSGESWREAVLHIGPITIFYGSFVGELLNFIVLAFAVFVVAKKIIKMEHGEK